MKKTIFLLVIFISLAFGIYLYRFQKPVNTVKVLPSVQQADVTPTGKKIGLPITLSIPSIGVLTKVESVGLDEKRNMDVPKKAENVAWFSLGVKPGEKGSAVMAGHLDDQSGAPAVFWNLKNLRIGGKIEVIDTYGKKYNYKVTKVQNYPWNEFPLQKVFADNSAPKLNLITCGGYWDKESKNYTQRTVVYSQIVE